MAIARAIILRFVLFYSYLIIYPLLYTNTLRLG
jgi:hypothetical protein